MSHSFLFTFKGDCLVVYGKIFKDTSVFHWQKEIVANAGGPKSTSDLIAHNELLLLMPWEESCKHRGI